MTFLQKTFLKVRYTHVNHIFANQRWFITVASI